MFITLVGIYPLRFDIIFNFYILRYPSKIFQYCFASFVVGSGAFPSGTALQPGRSRV